MIIKISGAGTACPSGAPMFSPGLSSGSCCEIFSFLCSVFLDQYVPCLYFFFILAIVLSVLLAFTMFGYHIGIYKFSYNNNTN